LTTGESIARVISKVRNAARAFLCLLAATNGTVAVSMAVGAPVLLGAVGVASDFAVFTMKKSKLQSAADAAALAAARELSVVASGSGSAAKASASLSGGGPIEAIARTYVATALPDATTTTTGVTVDSAKGAVQVTLSDAWHPFFAHFLGADITPIVVDARAELVGESKVCVIALKPTGAGALSMTKNSHLEGQGCSVYSNSTNSQGVSLSSGSSITADLVCSAGGVLDKGAVSSTKVLTDCPPMPDPLANRKGPTVGACNYSMTIINKKTVTLSPGVYCGGITVMNGSNVTFSPGNYIIKDGPFIVKDTSKIKGKNVAFYLTGLLSLIQFFDNATIDLSGAEDGVMAGLLFFEDPSSTVLRVHNIRASNAFNLTGTIYLPKGNLMVDPAAAVAQQSAYTAIIVNKLTVDNGPSLVLNTNYGGTSVPVPDGIRASADVVLSE